MAKYDIHRNPKTPSPEETKKFQNFDSVLNDYESVHKPWWVLQNILKKPKLVRILVLAVIVILTLIITHQQYKKGHPDTENTPEAISDSTENSF